MSHEQMIAALKALGYTNIYVKGGKVPLEKAPKGNVYYMYKRITGRRKDEKAIGCSSAA